MIPLVRASKEELNSTNFSFIYSTFQCGVMGTDTCLQFHCVPMVKVVTAVDFKCS